MKGWDHEGHTGPKNPLPDSFKILDPPVDNVVSQPSSEQKEPTNVRPPVPVEDTFQQRQPQQEDYPDEGYGESAAPF